MKKYFNKLEYNCIQVAIDHLIDDLTDALSDKKNILFVLTSINIYVYDLYINK